MLRVVGEIELASVELLRVALDALLDQRPAHLVVDLAEVRFCSGQGLAELVGAGRTAERHDVGYALGAPSAHIERLWGLMWPAADIPTRYPDTATAVLAAMAGRHPHPSGAPPTQHPIEPVTSADRTAQLPTTLPSRCS